MTGRVPALLVLALSLAAPAAADVDAVRRTWLERIAVATVDTRCNLFTDGERMALRSGLYQAEGELLRTGFSRRKMDQQAEEVRAHAATLACSHPEVLSVALSVRNAYREFTRTVRLDYATQRGSWAASRSTKERWTLSQTDKSHAFTLGLRRAIDPGAEPNLAVAMPAGGQVPSSVQLIMRDVTRMPDPWLGSLSGATAALIAAPPAIAHTEWAGRVVSATTPEGAAIWVFTFRPEAIALLEALDPREALSVVFIPSERDRQARPKTVLFEVGDFRAARAFSLIPSVEPVAAAGAPAPPHG